MRRGLGMRDHYGHLAALESLAEGPCVIILSKGYQGMMAVRQNGRQFIF